MSSKRKPPQTPPSVSKKLKTRKEGKENEQQTKKKSCVFCHFSEDETKDEGDFRPFTIDGNEIYVHQVCLLFSRSANRAQNDSDIIRRKIKSKNTDCCSENCKSSSRQCATIVCDQNICRNQYHYRCGLSEGTFLPNGYFFCPEHKNFSPIISKEAKDAINWPGDVEYLFNNDWSEISAQDKELIAQSAQDWETYVGIQTKCVKISKVAPTHWAWTQDMPYELVATKKICEGDAICEIVGLVQKIDEDVTYLSHITRINMTMIKNEHIKAFTENYTKNLVIDSSTSGNESRYINFLTTQAPEHLAPNARLVTVWSMEKLKVYVVAKRAIATDEAIILGAEHVWNDMENGRNKIRQPTDNSEDMEVEPPITTSTTFPYDDGITLSSLFPSLSPLPSSSPTSCSNTEKSPSPIKEESTDEEEEYVASRDKHNNNSPKNANNTTAPRETNNNSPKNVQHNPEPAHTNSTHNPIEDLIQSKNGNDNAQNKNKNATSSHKNNSPIIEQQTVILKEINSRIKDLEKHSRFDFMKTAIDFELQTVRQVKEFIRKLREIAQICDNNLPQKKISLKSYNVAKEMQQFLIQHVQVSAEKDTLKQDFYVIANELIQLEEQFELQQIHEKIHDNLKRAMAAIELC